MIIPIIIFIASATLGAPTAITHAETPLEVTQSATLGEYVRAYYKDTPILAEIAWCESRMRHLNKDGTIFHGRVDPDDIGVMQINTRYHAEEAAKRNLDLYTLGGNLAYAQALYDKEGTKPWRASQKCWSAR